MKDYNAILRRMGGIFLGDSKQSQIYYEDFNVNGLLEALEEWDAAHPVKTYAQDFFEKHPDAIRTEAGTPVPCFLDVNRKGKCPLTVGMNHEKRACCAYHYRSMHDQCWNRPMPDNR